ncbi:MAG: PD-(D/E)XK nuclease family protein [Bacillota bacterium]|nr:PD-(D/E)XK nuclease family protein [Bacillota bacterium]
MLYIIKGRAKSGKTRLMLESVIKRAGTGPQIIIVPETSSHITERLLAKTGGSQIGLLAGVYTFSSLAKKIFSEVGGLCDSYLDDAGRLLTMRLCVSRAEASLSVYNKIARKPEFINGLISFADEMKSAAITPEELLQASFETGGSLKKRLSDLAHIYAVYTSFTEEGSYDPRDKMTRLLKAVKVSRFFNGADVYFDSFSGFTKQELDLMAEIMKKARSVSVFFTCGEDEEEVFKKPVKTIEKLTRLAKKQGISISCSCLDSGQEESALTYLERNLFDYGAAPFESECPELGVFAARDMFEECERAASKIIKLVRKDKLRWRDVAVISRAFDSYAPILEIVFERYKIPAFFSRKTDILIKPVVSFLISAVDTVRSDFSFDTLFSYLKTRLSGIRQDDADKLENYVFTWGVKGKQWTDDGDWNFNPDGFAPFTEDSEKRLSDINRIKDDVRGPLLRLKKTLAEAETGGDYAAVLYGFMEDTGLAEAISKESARLTAKGEGQLADEYSQLFNILTDALSQFANVLENEKLDLREFYELFTLLLTGYDVGTIPAAIDAVTLGDFSVAEGQHFPAVFIIGAADGMFPPPNKQDGLLTDRDREELISLGFELGEDPGMRAYEEDYYIYRMISSPIKRLSLSYPLFAGGEAKQRPAYALSRLLRLFPAVKTEYPPQDGGAFKLESEIAGFDLALSDASEELSPCLKRYFEKRPEFKGRLLLAERAAGQKRGPIGNAELIEKLYGKEIRMSATRAEKFESCRFAFFMRYGLKAKNREAAAFDAPAVGTFIHYILEKGVKELCSAPGGIAAATDEDAEIVCRRFTDAYADEVLFGLGGKTKRFIYLFGRLQKCAGGVLKNVLHELQSSLFTPLDFELNFSNEGDIPPPKTEFSNGVLSLNGKVDRVDGYVKDDRLYLRVVDYKTGNKSFSLSDVLDGLDLQLLLYLFTIEEFGLKRYEERLKKKIEEITPAGVLYVPAHEPRLRAGSGLSEGEIEALTLKELRRSGLILNEVPVIEAMENGISGEGRFIPVKLTLDKTVAAISSVATREQFIKLKKHIRKTLREMGELITKGNTEANPYRRGVGESICDYCELKSACLFDESGPYDKMRMLAHQSRSEALSRLYEGGEPDECIVD